RHSLATGEALTAERNQHIEGLARNIAGGSTDIVSVGYARTIAEAEFDLAQIRRVKLGLISRVMAFGEAKRLPASHVIREAKRPRFEAPAMPTTEPERTAEAVRRTLPELIKLDRYERRAAGRRARALHRLLQAQKDRTT